MLAFALKVLLLFPLGNLPLQNTLLPLKSIPPLRNTATEQWTVKDGHIMDASGKEVGIYGLDILTQRLMR